MSDSVMVRPSPLVRLLSWARALSIVQQPEDFSAGPEFGSDIAASPKVNPIDEMSAYTLAWVYICVQAASADLAGLPVYVKRDGEAIWKHEAIDLLSRPRTRANAVVYARQRLADWYLTGNGYDLIIRSPTTYAPLSLQRLHPAKMKPVLATNGDVRAWEYSTGAAPVYYDAADVIHVSDISYSAGPDGVLGVSRIRAVMRELNVDVKALELAAQSASRGAPAFIVRPASDDDRWDQEQVGAISKSINRMLASVSGGALVMGGRTEVTPLGFSARDMEYIQQREQTRQAVLSAFRVTPTIAGLPGANYATADKEAEGYWQARRSDAAVFEAALSPLAEMLGRPGDVIRFDFSGVAALQSDRSERLNRAQQLWIMGVPLRAALEAEGLGDIQWEDEPPRPAAAPPPVATDDDGARSFEAVLSGQQEEAPRWTMPTTEDARATEWRGLEDTLRGPAEKRFAGVMTRFLRDQRQRIAARARLMLRDYAADNTRNVDTAAIFQILDADAELRALLDAGGPELEAAIERAITVMSKRLGAQLKGQDVSAVARKAFEDSLGYVHGTSMDAAVAVIREGVAQGQSPTVISERLQRAAAFQPARALMVARTEITRAVNAGGVAAIEQAAADGVGVSQVEWLSSRDTNVRSTHQHLDGQRRPVGGTFEVGGKTAGFPGGFGDPALDANCRCTVLPVLDD